MAQGVLVAAEVADLSAPATRGQLARALSTLRDDGAVAGDPGRPRRCPLAWPTARWCAALGLRAERQGLGRLASADGVRLRLPPGFATEVLARELGLRHNYLSPDDAWSAAASSP